MECWPIFRLLHASGMLSENVSHCGSDAGRWYGKKQKPKNTIIDHRFPEWCTNHISD
jgi:hypothetical protein